MCVRLVNAVYQFHSEQENWNKKKNIYLPVNVLEKWSAKDLGKKSFCYFEKELKKKKIKNEKWLEIK